MATDQISSYRSQGIPATKNTAPTLGEDAATILTSARRTTERLQEIVSRIFGAEPREVIASAPEPVPCLARTINLIDCEHDKHNDLLDRFERGI